MTTLFIKNMVCNRCIMAVKSELDKLGIEPIDVQLGEVTLEKDLTAQEKEKFSKALVSLGFEMIDDKKSRIIEQIKNIIIDLVHHQENDIKTNLSELLSEKLHARGMDYGTPMTATISLTISGVSRRAFLT